MKSKSHKIFGHKFTQISGKKLKRWKKKYSIEFIPLQILYQCFEEADDSKIITRQNTLYSTQSFYDIFKALENIEEPVEIFFFHDNSINDHYRKRIDGYTMITKSKSHDAFVSESEMLYVNNVMSDMSFDVDEIHQALTFNCFIKFETKEEHMMYRLTK